MKTKPTLLLKLADRAKLKHGDSYGALCDCNK